MFADLKPKVVLFDFYRTLLDIWTDEDDPAVWDKLACFLRYRGLSVDGGILHQSYAYLVKQSLEQSGEKYPEISVYDIFRKLFSDLGYSDSDELFTATVQLFRALNLRHFELFFDTLPTLQFLSRNYQLGLVTDAQRVFFEPEIQMTGLGPYFDVMIVSSDYPFHKPDPRMFTMAIEKMGFTPNQAIFVGDSWSRDVIGAQAVGIQTILLNRKNQAYSFEDSQKPYRIITSMDELRGLV